MLSSAVVRTDKHNDLKFILLVFFIYAGLSIGCFLMLRIAMSYTSFKDDVQFLLLKQDYVHNPIWKTAFYIHVFSAIISLFSGFTQFSNNFFNQYRKFHRLIGKIYVTNILAVNVPAGMILAICANGLWPGKIAFIILDILWFIFTYKAVSSARHKDFTSHRNYMIRSYALTFSAITLRTWNLVLSNSFNLDPIHLYMMDAWLGFVPNLLVAEGIIRIKASID